MSDRRTLAIVIAALVSGAGTIALIVTSDHLAPTAVWAVFAPLVVWSFVGTGLYAERRRPESRVGTLMIVFGFAWCLSALGASNAPLVYSIGLITGGLWGGVFLHLVMTFPSGRLAPGWDRRLVIAGYVTFTVAAPTVLVSGPEQLGCDDCPANVFLIERDDTLAAIALSFQLLLYSGLFVIVLVRLVRRWRATAPLERLQLTPVYGCGLLTFLLMTTVQGGAGEGPLWAALIATALLPLAFVGGLLRSRLAWLDSELRASRLRIVETSDTERRRLERNLHDGAQARLVGLALLLGHARRTADTDPQRVGGLLDEALSELRTSLSELRELARGIHPAVLTEKGLDAALYALASRAPVPVTLNTAGADGRLPEAVEVAAYFVVAEALANVAKYAQASTAHIDVQRADGRITVAVSDDGIGGADAANGSGLRGLTDRVAALDGTLSIDSPPGGGTRLEVEIPFAGRAGPHLGSLSTGA